MSNISTAFKIGVGSMGLLKNPGAPLTNRSAPGFFSRCQRRFLAQKLKKLRCFFGNKFHKIKERKLYGAKILTKNHKKKLQKYAGADQTSEAHQVSFVGPMKPTKKTWCLSICQRRTRIF